LGGSSGDSIFGRSDQNNSSWVFGSDFGHNANFNFYGISSELTAVPEPATWSGLLPVLTGLFFARRRRKVVSVMSAE
jgi:hypothetical protein